MSGEHTQDDSYTGEPGTSLPDPILEGQPWAVDPARDEDYEPSTRPPSVLILTMNEEINIRQCLETLRFSDDIVVLDSGSTDATSRIVREFPNVRLIRRPFDTEWKQRNFGLHNVQFKHPWVYICDADERVPETLRDELVRSVASADEKQAAFRIRYKNMFMGRWVRRGGLYPVWIIRLVRPTRVTYEKRETNVHPIVDGEVHALCEHFVHHSFNAGLYRWFMKHNFYSDQESVEALKLRETKSIPVGELFSSDPMARRRAIKNASFALPLRALARFIYMYFVRLGLLDGRAGFEYACMISMYEYWIELKMRESRNRWLDRTLERANEILEREQVAGGGIARDA